MAVYTVTYDLYARGQNYGGVEDRLEKLDSIKAMRTFWIVDTNYSASELQGYVRHELDENDTVMVTEIKRHWSSWNLRKDVVSWLKNPHRSFK